MKRHFEMAGLAFALACARDSGPVVIGLAGPFSEARGLSMRRAAELAAVGRQSGPDGGDDLVRQSGQRRAQRLGQGGRQLLPGRFGRFC